MITEWHIRQKKREIESQYIRTLAVPRKFAKRVLQVTALAPLWPCPKNPITMACFIFVFLIGFNSIFRVWGFTGG